MNDTAIDPSRLPSPLLHQLMTESAAIQERLPQLLWTTNQLAMMARQQKTMDRMEHMADFEYGKCNPDFEPLPPKEDDEVNTIQSGIFLDSKALNALNKQEATVNWLPWLLGTLLALLLLSLLGWWLFKNYFGNLPAVTPHYGLVAIPGEPPPTPDPIQ